MHHGVEFSQHHVGTFSSHHFDRSILMDHGVYYRQHQGTAFVTHHGETFMSHHFGSQNFNYHGAELIPHHGVTFSSYHLCITQKILGKTLVLLYIHKATPLPPCSPCKIKRKKGGWRPHKGKRTTTQSTTNNLCKYHTHLALLACLELTGFSFVRLQAVTLTSHEVGLSQPYPLLLYHKSMLFETVF